MAAGYHYGVKLRITPTGLSPASAAASLAALPPPALPSLRGTASPSATRPGRPAPHGVPVGVCAPPTGLPVLLPSPSSMRAAATTPAGLAGAFVARFPTSGSLPRLTGGSAPALLVSRPARRSLALRPAWSLGRPRRPVCSECFRPCRCLHHPLRLLPAGATFAGRDSHPLRDGAFPRHTVSISRPHLTTIRARHGRAWRPTPGSADFPQQDRSDGGSKA